MHLLSQPPFIPTLYERCIKRHRGLDHRHNCYKRSTRFLQLFRLTLKAYNQSSSQSLPKPHPAIHIFQPTASLTHNDASHSFDHRAHRSICLPRTVSQQFRATTGLSNHQKHLQHPRGSLLLQRYFRRRCRW